MIAFGAVVLVLALAVLVLAEPGGARGRETLRAKREALGEVRRQLDEARTRASQARAREVSLLAELEQIDRTMAKKRGELARLDQRIVHLEAELGELEGRRGRVAEDTVAQQAALATRLRALDRLRSTPATPAPLGETEQVARTQAVSDLSRVARLDARRLAEFGEAAERLQARRETVNRGRRELVDLRRAVLTERAAISGQAQRRRTLLAGVSDDRAVNERMAAELEEAARRLEMLVRQLGRRAETRAVVARPAEPGPPPAVGLGVLRGQLPWPTEGRIVAGFGRQVHPRFGTETIRHGVEIEASEGAAIRAVHGGTVLYRGWLRGYGNLVILDHGQGYYTLYAHASEVDVEEGEQVRGGQRVARVGETGSADGPRLYFEVRYQGRAEDPQAWLRRRL